MIKRFFKKKVLLSNFSFKARKAVPTISFREYHQPQEVELGGSEISLKCPTYIVWGAGTDVGKTLISAGICHAASNISKQSPIFYYKPVQTGFPEDSDADVVASICGGSTEFGDHACQLLVSSDEIASFPAMICSGKSDVVARTEFAWSRPIGPHLAVKHEGRRVSDDRLMTTVKDQLAFFAKRAVPGSIAFVETAGGVASPAPSGNIQCDVLRRLRLPGIMMSALDSLILRGMDVACVVLQDNGMHNDLALARLLHAGAYGRFGTGERGEAPVVVVVPPLPKRRHGNSMPHEALKSWILQSDFKFRKAFPPS